MAKKNTAAETRSIEDTLQDLELETDADASAEETAAAAAAAVVDAPAEEDAAEDGEEDEAEEDEEDDFDALSTIPKPSKPEKPRGKQTKPAENEEPAMLPAPRGASVELPEEPLGLIPPPRISKGKVRDKSPVAGKIGKSLADKVPGSEKVQVYKRRRSALVHPGLHQGRPRHLHGLPDLPDALRQAGPRSR
jgi:hypothetical protein